MSDGSGKNTSEEALAVVFGVIAIFVIGAIAYNFHYFADAWRWLRFGELYLFQWIPPFELPFLGVVDFGKAIYFLGNLSEYGLTYETMNRFDNIYGMFIGLPLGIYLVYAGLKLTSVDPNMTRRHDIESIFSYFASIYPYLQEVYDAHPQNKSLHYNRAIPDSYRWGKMVNPLKFATMSPPLLLEKEGKKNATYNKCIYEGGLFDDDLAEYAFAAQLGKHWTGIENLEEHEKVTFEFLRDRLPVDNARVEKFVIRCWNTMLKLSVKHKRSSCPKSSRLTDEENELMQLFWNNFEKQILIVTGHSKKTHSPEQKKSILNKLKSEETVLALCTDKPKTYRAQYRKIRAMSIMGRHAYVRTGLMEMNAEACLGGRISVEPIKSVVKSQSRQLWYALKASGRRTSFPECAGCFAHWLVEKEIGQPIAAACVQEAVTALRLDLNIEEE